MTLNTKLAATALAITSLGLVGAADAATAATKSKTKITISVDGENFSGSLSSKKASCESDRKVTLFRKQGTKITKIGSDIANDDGDWSVDTGKDGSFFALVKPNTKCLGVTSKTVKSED
jgi:hypothetical protein